MNLQSIKHKFNLGTMDLSEIKWLIDTVEQQQKEFAYLSESSTETDTIISSLEAENKRLSEKIQAYERKTKWKVFEEDLKIAQELALLKGEMSG